MFTRFLQQFTATNSLDLKKKLSWVKIRIFQRFSKALALFYNNYYEGTNA
jgi:hypothetical protein